MESIETSEFIVPEEWILLLMRALSHLANLFVPKLQVFRDWGVLIVLLSTF